MSPSKPPAKPARQRSTKASNVASTLDQAAKQASGLKARRLALETLLTIERERAYANLALAAAFGRTQLSERDRAFVTALVQGVVRNRLNLDQNISEISSRPLNQLPASLKNVLRLGFYQLMFMQNLPPSAVLNTTTELAKTGGHAGLAKYANGVMRNFYRRIERPDGERGDTAYDTGDSPSISETATEEIVNTSTPEDLVNQWSVRFSMPAWIIERWLRNFGPSETAELLKFSQSTPVLTVRTNETAITAEGLQQIFAGKGINCKPGTLVDSCINIERAPPKRRDSQDPAKHFFQGSPQKLPGFAEGLFSIQDEAAAFVSKVTDPKPGELVIDLCAAPGGKTVHLAELMENRGRVIAVDINEARLNLIKKNRARAALTNIETAAADGRTFKIEQLADRVLVDAPCSGTGVLNRRSDLRYQLRPEDLPKLVELQRELLANATRLIKPGGILVYSTCSIEPEENFENIRWFLRNFEEFDGDDLSRYLPATIVGECAPNFGGLACKTESELNRFFMVQLLPSRHSVSGFFVARLRRKS